VSRGTGDHTFNRNTDDQAKLYDELTPLGAKVTAADVTRSFKPAWFGTKAAGPARVEDIRREDVGVVRDRFGVCPYHVEEPRRAHGRGRLGRGRGPGASHGVAPQRGPALAAIDAPRSNAFAVALTARRFVPSAQTERFIAAQPALLRGREGRRVLADVNAYVGAINACYRKQELPYLDKDLRTLLGRPVQGAFRTRFCGHGTGTSHVWRLSPTRPGQTGSSCRL
jgi:hypothetical protein